MQKLRVVPASNRGRGGRWDGILCGCTCDEIIPVAAEAAEEDNRLKETEGAAVEPTSPLPPPTVLPAQADPCEGKERKPPAVSGFVHPYVFNRNWNTQPSDSEGGGPGLF